MHNSNIMAFNIYNKLRSAGCIIDAEPPEEGFVIGSVVSHNHVLDITGATPTRDGGMGMVYDDGSTIEIVDGILIASSFGTFTEASDVYDMLSELGAISPSVVGKSPAIGCSYVVREHTIRSLCGVSARASKLSFIKEYDDFSWIKLEDSMISCGGGENNVTS